MRKLSHIFSILLFVLLVQVTLPLNAAEKNVIEVSGKVKNLKNKKAIGNVSITIPGTNIGTVTNQDGDFTLKIPIKNINAGLKAEQIGFQSVIVPYSEIKRKEGDVTILMNPTAKVLKELLVLGGDPKEIVAAAIKKIPENYSDHDNLFSGFYRETVQKGRRFINVSEAMVDVLKKSYDHRNSNGEKVRIHKGRSLVSPNPKDTLSIKLMGGPYLPIQLDAVKNGEHLFSLDEINNFEFKLDNGTMIDDRTHYVINFKPIVSMPYPLYSGTLYIDGEDLTISRVEFELDVKDKNKVTRSILQKKPGGLNFKPLEVSGTVTYKTVDGKSYINYINSKMRFKCDWKKRLFSSTYTSNAEMVMVDREDAPEKNLKMKDSFGKRSVFSDIVENYWEEDFWKDYNIIEPTESLEEAVDRLRKS